MAYANEQFVYLTDLLHYNISEKKGSDLEKSLKEYQFLLSAAAEAIENIQNIDLEKFDCVVGENACQIRAIKIALIASKNLEVFDELNLKIATSLAKIDTFLQPSALNTFMRDRQSLKEIIEKNELIIKLNYDEVFLIKSYLLSEMKESDAGEEFLSSIMRKDICVPDKLREQYPEISSRFFSKLAKNLRKLLSESSVHFVKSMAKDLDEPSLFQMISDHALEHNTLLCTPTFWTFKTLFFQAQKQKLPLILHVKFLNKLDTGYQVIDEEYLLYKPCEIANTYIKAELSEEDMTRPACVIQGVICPKEGQSLPSKEEWVHAMSTNSIIDVMLAVAADHRQYPDPDKTIPVHDKEYEYYKNLAESKGFSLNNPTTFFAQHIYCSQIIRKLSAFA